MSTGVPQRQSKVDPSSNVNKEELERSLKAKYQKQIDEVYEMNNVKFGVVSLCVEHTGSVAITFRKPCWNSVLITLYLVYQDNVGKQEAKLKQSW